MALDEARLLDTQRAFDSVAADYDGPRGNNELIQRMRVTLWETVHARQQRIDPAHARHPVGNRACAATTN